MYEDYSRDLTAARTPGRRTFCKYVYDWIGKFRMYRFELYNVITIPRNPRTSVRLNTSHDAEKVINVIRTGFEIGVLEWRSKSAGKQ